MTKIIKSPETREIVVKMAGNLLKLGSFAAISLFSNRVFKEAGTEFLNGALQSYRRIKNIA